MQQTFFPEAKPYSERPITVKIIPEEDTISFHFKAEDNREFYWARLHEWKNDPFWPEHMKDKMWFTEEMETFINKNIKQ